MGSSKIPDRPPKPNHLRNITSEHEPKEYHEAFARLQEMARSFLYDTSDSGPIPQTPDVFDNQALEPLSYGILVTDQNGVIQTIDEGTERIFGYTQSDLIGKHIQFLLETTGAQVGSESDLHLLANQTTARRKDGETFQVRCQISKFRDSDKQFLVLARDVTQLIRALKENERINAKYRALVEQLPVVTFTISIDQRRNEIYVSPQIEELLGYSPVEWASDPIRWFHQIHPSDRERISIEFARAINSGTLFRIDSRLLTRSKKTIWVHLEVKMVRDRRNFPAFIQGVAFDITEAKEAEERVKLSLREKELLLKEIHHRVKNNLQITSSLLRLQFSKIKDKEALNIFIGSENRIQAMALIHEKLYQSKDLARIDFRAYIHDLCNYLSATYKGTSKDVKLILDVEEVFLGIDLAVPCALILNELISNSMKYAFPGNQREREPEIKVRFYERAANLQAYQPDLSDREILPEGQRKMYVMNISDNGVGLKKDIDISETKSLGFHLVLNLADQIDGKFENRRPDIGTEFEIVFPVSARG